MSERLPLVLREAMKRARAIVLERDRFPELGGRRGLQLAFTAGRQRRSERLEALGLVMQAILLRTDLVTLRCGTVRPDGRCIGITEENLCTWTELRPRRVERAVRDLRDAGYLGWHQRRVEIAPGRWLAYPAVRSVTVAFFARLGLRAWLENERRDASGRHRATVTPIDIRARRELRRVVRHQQLAAKRATAPRRPDEQAAAKAIQLLQDRITRRLQ